MSKNATSSTSRVSFAKQSIAGCLALQLLFGAS
ncbi:MAG: hypothetical protein JWO91_3384, partial [Acidobacteriaceae bacterium]|nr:hypothetical protein [Acidobacteriaceae bacterium]